MFLVPLNKTIKDLKFHEESGTLNVAARQKSKVVFVASKVFVLAATASVSTLLMFVFYAAMDISQIDFVVALDGIVNVICLMLMSPYYCGPKGNEHRLYRILCRPAIYCFCQQRFSLVYHKVCEA